MRLIDRYLLRQMLGPTLLATGALTAVALLSQSLSGLDLIVNQRQSAAVFLRITLLYMPQLINIILPIAVFVAALVSFNRLQMENEVMVCFAGGMSRWRVISPAMRLAATIAFLALLMNLFVQPAAFRTLRQELFAIRTDLAATMVREGEFTEPAPGLTVYTQSVNGSGDMNNLFIHQVKPQGRSTTYTAEHGRLAQRMGRPVLIMRNGSMQEFSEKGALNFLTFDEYVFDLSPLTDTSERIHYKSSDRYLHELFVPDLTQAWEQRNRTSLLAEGHARLATPLYNITFMAMALAAIIGGGYSRLGYGRRIAVMAGLATLTRVIGFVVQAACDDNTWLNAGQYAVPLIALALALHSIFRRPVRPPRVAEPAYAGPRLRGARA
jgi:lipopolysaccharide export system permease protein